MEDGRWKMEDGRWKMEDPITFTEMGIILNDDTIRAIAESTIITPGCCKQLTPDEIVEILNECK